MFKKNDYWQESNYDPRPGTLVQCVMRLYDRARYLDPPTTLRALVQQLPKEVESALMTAGLTSITIIDKTVIKLQSIEDQCAK